jgi:hypothetical protein
MFIKIYLNLWQYFKFLCQNRSELVAELKIFVVIRTCNKNIQKNFSKKICARA